MGVFMRFRGGLFRLTVALALALVSMAPTCNDDDDDGGAADDEAGGDVECPPADNWIQVSVEGGGQPAPGIWLFTDSASELTWHQATALCQQLADLAYCGFVDWRVPSVAEWRTMIDGCPSTETGGACPMGDACLAGSCYDISTCWDTCTPHRWEGPGTEGEYSILSDYVLGWRWTGDPVADDPNRAWIVMFESAAISWYEKDESFGMMSACIAPSGKKP